MFPWQLDGNSTLIRASEEPGGMLVHNTKTMVRMKVKIFILVTNQHRWTYESVTLMVCMRPCTLAVFIRHLVKNPFAYADSLANLSLPLLSKNYNKIWNKTINNILLWPCKIFETSSKFIKRCWKKTNKDGKLAQLTTQSNIGSTKHCKLIMQTSCIRKNYCSLKLTYMQKSTFKVCKLKLFMFIIKMIWHGVT